MAFYPTDAYRRNLEKLEGEIQTGPWRISALHDLVSEKRFSLFSLKSRSVTELASDVLTFRAETASSIAPATCPQTLSITTDGERVEILTEHFDLIDPDERDEAHLKKVFGALIQTLALFERHHFHIGSLFPEALGLDKGGNVFLLPTAYVLPFFKVSEAGVTSATLKIDQRMRKQPRIVETPIELESGGFHTALLGNLIGRMSGGSSSRARGGATKFGERLRRAADEISAGEVMTLDAVYKALFGKRLDKAYRRFAHARGGTSRDRTLENAVDRVVDAAAGDGTVVLLHGSPFTGTSSILKRAASLLDVSENHVTAPPRPHRAVPKNPIAFCGTPE